MGMFGPSQKEVDLLERMNDLNVENGTLREAHLDMTLKMSDALHKRDAAMEELQEFKDSFQAAQEINAENEAELHEDLAELRAASKLPPPVNTSQEENDEAAAILKNQAVRELENANLELVEREADLRAEIDGYKGREFDTRKQLLDIIEDLEHTKGDHSDAATESV